MYATNRSVTRTLLVLFIWCSLFIAGCFPEAVDPLPKESQSGEDMIACRIDGNVWTPLSTFSWTPMNSGTGRIARYSTLNKTLFVGGTNKKDGRSISFSLINCSGVGTYRLNNKCDDMVRPTANCGEFSPYEEYISDDTYWTDVANQGEVVITKLTDKIVAGRFSFKAVNKKTNKVVNVTDGRFDFYYAPGF